MRRLVLLLAVIAPGLIMSGWGVSPIRAATQVCEVWVVGASNSISVIDVATSQVSTVSVGPGSHSGVAFSRSGDAAFITSGAGTRRVDTATRDVTLIDASRSYAIVSSPVADVLYVSNATDDEYFRLDALSGAMIGSTISAGRSPFQMRGSADGAKVYATLYNSAGPAEMQVINTSAFTSSFHSLEVAAGDFSQPSGLALTADGSTLYVSARSGDKIRTIDTSNMSITATMTSVGAIGGLTLTPDDSTLIAADGSNNAVKIIDTATMTITASIAVQGGPRSIAVDAAGRNAYVTNFYSNTVSKIDLVSNSVVETFAVESFPDEIGINCRTVAAPAPTPVPSTPIWRVSMDPTGGVCADGGVTRDAEWTSVFVGYRYLPGPGECEREEYSFIGWADADDPDVVLTLPLLTDPSDGVKRWFVAANHSVVAVWEKVEEVLEDLTGTAPGAFVGGPDRRTAEAGGVVDGYYIPPGTVFGPWMLTSPR